MVRKKIDTRLRTTIENGVKLNHRSFIVLVGDRGRDQVVNLHYILSKSVVKARPSVLWCYKNDLGFSSHRRKRMRQVKKAKQKGTLDVDEDNPFELFVSSTNIRYCYYKDTHKILGQTYGMLVLQDFEAVTPNILARTIETVEGGGIVVLLLKTMTSLRQLYTMSMDVHNRYRTEGHQDIEPRFNERFILSLSNCQQSLVLDDEFNVLPISSHAMNISPVSNQTREDTPNMVELQGVKQSLIDTQPVGSLVENTKTLDQAKAVLTFIEAISEKTLRSTVALTAGRGRGKSAALGLSIAAAVAYGYSNIFVTSPTPENLGTVFEFIFKGLDSLEYEEHLDYTIIQSSNPEFHNAIVRVDIFRLHRQTIQYILPTDASKLGQAELVVIDEAAAIPLPYVKQLLGPYLVFMSSTINGYEGTGRSLSLKLIQQLRVQSSSISNSKETGSGNDVSAGGRVLREIELKEPIRYGINDPIEKFLNNLLCLNASVSNVPTSGCPHPRDCELYYINRDALMSYHKASESFLQRIMALFVSSHYKNSPNDLQMMSDAPSHHLFCLMGPIDTTKNALPEILCVIQVSLEGDISKESVAASLARGSKESGDLIPWTITQQYQDREFPSLSGARVVRIASHPAYQGMGYGTRAIEQLKAYYSGDIISLDMQDDDDSSSGGGDENDKKLIKEHHDGNLLKERLKARKNLPPLLSKLTERKPEALHYIGSSFGVTTSLFKFWKNTGFVPVYLRQTPNQLTGEHTCVVIHALNNDNVDISAPTNWINTFSQDFSKRFINLLGFQFSSLPSMLALSILQADTLLKQSNSPGSGLLDDDSSSDNEDDGGDGIDLGIGFIDQVTKIDSVQKLNTLFTAYDLKRLDAYSKGMVDYHVIMDTIPTIAALYFSNRLCRTRLSRVQASILLNIGLQRRTVDRIVAETNLPSSQILALFNRSIKRIVAYFDTLVEKGIEEDMGEYTDKSSQFVPQAMSIDQKLDAEAEKVENDMKRKQEELITGLNLQKYAVGGTDAEWSAALKNKKLGDSLNNTVAITSKSKREKADQTTKNIIDEVNKTTGYEEGVSGQLHLLTKKKKGKRKSGGGSSSGSTKKRKHK